jgi:hypothetical protein
MKNNANVPGAFMRRGPHDETLHAAGTKSADNNHAKAVRLVLTCQDEILHSDMGARSGPACF